MQVFLAERNGFADDGGRAIIQAVRQVNIMKELDLSANRMTDSFLKLIAGSLDAVTNLEELHVSCKHSFRLFVVTLQLWLTWKWEHLSNTESVWVFCLSGEM